METSMRFLSYERALHGSGYAVLELRKGYGRELRKRERLRNAVLMSYERATDADGRGYAVLGLRKGYGRGSGYAVNAV